VGDALGVDWLRFPMMYVTGPKAERLSAAGDYQLADYAPWWGAVLLHGGLGAILLLAAGRRRFALSDSGVAA
jgi:hypothetical protein